LKEGSSVGDLLVRRAVVYGLTRISEDWAYEILEKIRVDDSQWIVRNAAAQAIEARQAPNSNIPHQWVHPSQAPWVIAFAARQGVGVAAGVFPIEMLLHALKAGDEDERMAALEYLRGMHDPDILTAIFNALYEGVGTVKEAAANALYELAASGVTLPSAESLLST
jgi:HEAT repeat protein